MASGFFFPAAFLIFVICLTDFNATLLSFASLEKWMNVFKLAKSVLGPWESGTASSF